jgi:hypothetical protein
MSSAFDTAQSLTAQAGGKMPVLRLKFGLSRRHEAEKEPKE